MIPSNRSRKTLIAHDIAAYRARNCIERCFSKLKHFRRFATRYDRRTIHFLGFIPPTELATLYNLSDLHVYLTVPYVLSQSLLQAMASECLILGSATGRNMVWVMPVSHACPAAMR